MAIVIPAFLIFAAVMLAMSLGVILRGRTIKGSCGGLGATGAGGGGACQCGAGRGSTCAGDGQAAYEPGCEPPAPAGAPREAPLKETPA